MAVTEGRDENAAAGVALKTEVDIEAEGRRLIERAWAAEIPVRLLGGLAIAARIPAEIRAVFGREYGDIDLVIPRRTTRRFVTFMEESGYAEDLEFNAMNGRTRLVFVDARRGREIDVFVQDFAMCHVVPLRLDDADRCARRELPLADLMLTKLQIVKLTGKDIADLVMLLMAHEVGDGEEDGIDVDWIGAVCANDWGLWRTATGNLARVAAALAEIRAPRNLQADAQRRLTRLVTRLEERPKSAKWRLRARVGERLRWYDEPDEK
jgi:hypothetical protein